MNSPIPHKPSVRLVVSFLLLFTCLSAYAQLSLVKDINVGADSTKGGQPANFFEWNSYVYFSYWTPQYGRELWRTDGTPGGTTMVKDISLGIPSSSPVAFTVAGGYLYFSAGDGTHGNELWRTDGTTGGTVMVADISPGFFSSNPTGLTLMGSNLYFSATTETKGAELWVTNPATQVTQLVKEINPRGASGAPSYLVELNGILYFNATDSLNDQELWRSDGTAAGTWMVKDILPGIEGSRPWYLTQFNGLIYFRTDGTDGHGELWKSDGTAAGTTKVLTASGFIYSLVATPNYLYFIDNFAGPDGNVWKSDGGSFSTMIFQSVYEGSIHKTSPTISNVGGNLFMNHLEIDTTDPFFQNVTSVSELLDDSGSVILNDYSFFLLFPFDSPYVETTLVKTASDEYYLTKNPLMISSSPNISKWNGSSFVEVKSFISGLTPAQVIGNKIVFGANQVNYAWTNVELFVSDGTPEGTTQLKEVVGQLSSSPVSITAVGDKIYFNATEGSTQKLFVSDGSSAGTKALSDSVSFGSYSQIHALGNVLLFSGRTTGRGDELWKTDGTRAGTVIVKDIWPGSYSSDCGYFHELKGKLIFTAIDPTYGFSLWKSDGTEAGTVMIKDLEPAFTYGGMYEMINASDSLIYFAFRDTQSGWELWRTDGTDAGTFIVKDIEPGSGDAYVRNLIVVKGIVYFSAQTISTGSELWRSDGTDAGTYIVKEINPGPEHSQPGNLTPFKDGLLFTSYSSSLWYTDGTGEGTAMIKDFPSSYVNGVWKSQYVSNLAEMGGEVFFLNAGELWKTDGTLAGTQSIIEVHPYNQYNGYPDGLVSKNGVLFFTSSEYDFIGNSVISFISFWKSNGTAEGTSMITQVSDASGYAVAGNSIFFAGTSELGAELWKYTVQNNITVKVNGNVISNNQLIDLGDHLTGSINVPVEIVNNGIDNVLFTSSPRFKLSANNQASFSVTDTNPFGKITPGNAYDATIAFTTSQSGVVSMNVNFPNTSISATSVFQLKADFTPAVTGDIHLPDSDLSLFPNPTHDFIRLTLPGQDRKEVAVFFVTGEKVGNTSSYESDLVLNVQSYTSGCYVVQVRTAKGVYYGKFIKK